MSQELGITVKKDQNPSEWYTQVVQKAEMADYAPVKGCMIIKPYGMKIWESIKEDFNTKIENTGAENAYFPLFIPESYLEKEEDIVEGFDPEVAWVTHGGDKELEERLAVRPTSESIIAPYMADEVRSHRDLPLRLNQWANVVRWEATDTRPFLRTREFLWQEGHTAHATEEGADEETMLRLEQYQEVIEDHLAIPSILGYKPEHDKFPGAKYTTTIETLMPDGKSIQSGTSHQLGQHFAEAFEIEFEDEDSETQTAWTTSWGLSTRTIGALIMAHGDDDGLRLPPRVAPTQVVVVPIYQEDNRDEVVEYAEEVTEELEEKGLRVDLDDRDHRTPGYKFNEWELKGVPLRVEIGPNEVEDNAVTPVRRDNGEKKMGQDREEFVEEAEEVLENIQESLYNELEEYLQENIREAESKNEILATIGKNRGYVKTRWCGKESCEEEIKDEVSAEIVVLPFEEDSKPATIQEKEDHIDGECAVCGEKAERWAYFAKNY
ncbi:proline--tRNA ligase [Candidatus Nanohalovita haloferacivicina]|uniref:proline--tRNA ligase n=1 Tax=Candidatus Nanohalovita haloferacivicina TaxID=2978046 RepID=UPI00325FA7C5|nr:Prolyl-tRNA synthetase [Candidatus Nanohalobia archaeon BNXNv]